ncbi:MAG: histone deacetylase [Candidatus Eisenbacteria bacterium]|nr:histone deacetylase [Candidatus Eisenbacteria bacterium]
MSETPFQIYRTSTFLAHDPGDGHPEHSGRLKAIYRDLDGTPIAGTKSITPIAADPRRIVSVHTEDHLARVAATSGVEAVQLDVDTATSALSYQAALLAVGATLQATEEVARGNASGAFALVRPPGHHAEATRAMGFCLFNNVAIAADFAVRELGLSRILVIDPDVHHGNGTQQMFYDRADVMYVSSHRFPFYPGSGWLDETGVGAGAGYTVNLPMTAGMGDADFLHLYATVVEPIVDQWQPELVLVSAGFDTWHADPMGGMTMTERGFTELFGLFHHWAKRHAGGRLVLALEGGYDLDGLASGVRCAIEVSTGAREAIGAVDAPVSPRAVALGNEVRRELAGRWSSLRG